MSTFYAASNKESTADLYAKRIFYHTVLGSTALKYTNLVDFNFAEKYLYGRVNRMFVPIVLNQTILPLKVFNKSIAPQQTLSAVNFVVDAFNGLSLEFKRCVSTQQIASNDPFLSNLIVHKAFEDPERLYNQYLTNYYNTILTEFRRRNVQVKNFDEFVDEFEVLMEASAPLFPFTKPAYIKNRLCPLNCSGLVVEIANLNYANDEEKINQFVTSQNWEFYVNACQSYGFMVDRRIPWRLVADIGSAAMVKYASAYGLTSTTEILTTGYSLAHYSFALELRARLLNLYNKVKLTNFVEVTDCNGSPRWTTVVPRNYTNEELSTIYSPAYFLELYFKIRFLEEESVFKDFEKEMIIDDSIELYNFKGAAKCLEVFERILNKTFDYRGSLSYIREQMEAIKNAETT